MRHINYTRINRREAKKAFNSGNLVTFVPSKLSPDSLFSTSSSIKSGMSFEDTISDRTQYYCGRNTGLRLKYYIVKD